MQTPVAKLRNELFIRDCALVQPHSLVLNPGAILVSLSKVVPLHRHDRSSSQVNSLSLHLVQKSPVRSYTAFRLRLSRPRIALSGSVDAWRWAPPPDNPSGGRSDDRHRFFRRVIRHLAPIDLADCFGRTRGIRLLRFCRKLRYSFRLLNA